MERSKAEGKRRMENKMKEEVLMDEEEDEAEEYVGEDNKKKKQITYSGSKGSGGVGSTQTSCQVEDCRANMTNAKPYHRRHKVCELHAKASTVMVAGLRQRFCQQCSRFHDLSEFDEAKRSCRRRLLGHNERRRKSSYDSHGEGSS
ncbi:hypothetical protein RJ640_030070 [Escallonia rubra]|uniref:Squamosa promoter-binding-like protein n=2 Tax=Escallonia rubra TaxID=112253 RepID=A0AA88U4N2_9ASTE|nr:hypothetical protein RJ640_030070 [Escallonia rubra]